MRTKDKISAIKLRQDGKTYSEIIQILQVPKSTLSEWLKNIPLTKRQEHELARNIRSKIFITVEKIRRTKLEKKIIRQQLIYKSSLEKILPLTKRELYIAGLLLYMGEGVKGDNSTVSLNNTDPAVVRFYLYWLLHGLGLRKERIRVAVHLYSDMNIPQSLDFWSRYLDIPKKQFVKPYIKETRKSDVLQKGYGKGTCGLYVYDRMIKLRLLGELRAICSIAGRPNDIIKENHRARSSPVEH